MTINFTALIDMLFALSECGYSYTECFITVAQEYDLDDEQSELLERSYMAAMLN